MKINKDDLQKYLNSFSGDFREIYFEKTKKFYFTCLNGIFRTPSYATLEWFSVLSREWKKEFFQAFTDMHNIDEKIHAFKNEYHLSTPEKQVILEGENELEISDIEDISFAVKDIIEYVQVWIETYTKKQELPFQLLSSEVWILLTKKAFIVWNTHQKFQSDDLFYVTLYAKFIGEKDGNREEVFEKITWIDIFQDLSSDAIEQLFSDTLKILADILDGQPSPNGKMDVIIANSAWWTIIHEAVGHGLEADLQNSSVYKDKIWEKVASEMVTIVDNPTLEKERGWYRFDHEWNAAQNTILIENGVLKSYLHNQKTAMKFWVASTWHGRKESYKHKTLVRMGNTYMLPWNDIKEDLISKISYGLYVVRIWGGQVNTTTGDFVFRVQNGILIENGKLTQSVRGANISWNGPEMLQEIYGICNDLDFFDGGTCWKWQAMPVSDGVPTFWTKLKVSWL